MSRFRILPTAALTEPAHAARTRMDDERMESLVVSIREVGVLEPLLVVAVDGKLFEVVAGHRRLLAARTAGIAELPCIVLKDAAGAAAAKIHENLEREDLSPSDEAVFYAELYERHGEDVDQVVALVKKSRAHVENRLNLLRGDKRVFEALDHGKISIGVAEELNRFEREDDRLLHLDSATRSGATVSQMRQWRATANQRAQYQRDDVPPVPGAPPLSPEEEARLSVERTAFAAAAPWELDSSKELRPCALCDEQLESWRMLKKHLCPGCATSVWPRFVAALRGGEA